MFVADVVRTWSYCGGVDPVKTFRSAASTGAEMPTNDSEVGTVTGTTTGRKIPPLRWVQVVMSPA
jgi:hypothetical protein